MELAPIAEVQPSFARFCVQKYEKKNNYRNFFFFFFCSRLFASISFNQKRDAPRAQITP
jgi:hypothetical protein